MMISILRKQIADQYHLYNNQKSTTKEIKKMAKELSMEEKDLLKLLGVSNIAMYNCLKNNECSFYIQVYSKQELQEIEEKVKEDLKVIPRVNRKMIELIKERYRISSRDIRKFLGNNYAQYIRMEKQNKYLEIKWDDSQKEDKLKFRAEEKQKKECRNQITNTKKYRISKELIEKVAKTENVTVEIAGEILGLKKAILKNIMEKKQLTTKLIDKELQYRVAMLELDLKYMPNNGERYYPKEEMEFMSVVYELTIDDIFYYLSDGKVMYEVYLEAFKNNPNGVWIGKKGRLSNEYEEENHKVLDKYITYIAKNMCYQYFCCDDDGQDFRSEAFEDIIENGKFYEKNLCHDHEMLNKILIKRAQFAMRNYYNRLPKELGLTLTYEGKEYENAEILADDRYNPEICCLEDKYSFLNEIEPIHTEIVKDIFENVDFLIDYPQKYLSKRAGQNYMTKDEFEEKMDEIRAFILKSKTAKIDKQGKVIPMFYVDE